MRFVNVLLFPLVLGCFVIMAQAQNETGQEEKTDQPAIEKENPKQPTKEKNNGLVIGKNLKVNMPLIDAFKLLGLPKSIHVQRGTESIFDSVIIEYPKYGLRIHALSAGTTVEGIEMNRKFTGRFDTDIKIGDDFKLIIEKYGVPKSFDLGVANYPDMRLFFILDNDKVISAKVFAKDTKLLSSRLAASKK
ncbi:MAG: hypothetical protein VYC17_04635 [Nitrospinota bacterium]|nr:hypothetical protein [Nitrospinota bacterium]